MDNLKNLIEVEPLPFQIPQLRGIKNEWFGGVGMPPTLFPSL